MKTTSRPSHISHQFSFAQRYGYALARARGIPIQTDLSAYNELIDAVLGFDLARLPDQEIRRRAAEARAAVGARRASDPRRVHRHDRGEASDDTGVAEALSLACEAAHRVLGQRPYPVQIAAAAAQYEGRLVQMDTGEGKTLAAVPAAYLGSHGGGCHIMTANDYLAQRDAEWMGDVYALLGCRAAHVVDHSGCQEKIDAYRADVTYLTPRRAGFDFLSDQLVLDPDDRVQRPFNMVIVDEADSLLIDESRIPLVIARENEAQRVDPRAVDAVVRRLDRDHDFTIDRTGRRCVLTPAGHETVRVLLGCPGIDEPDGLAWYAATNVGLHAHHLLTREVDYIVRGEIIELVDEFTGRVADRRRWPDGIQAALEAKEGVPIRSDGEICGSITVQHFIDRYPRLAAMTATAVPSAREFHDFYGISVVIIPPNRASNLVHESDRMFSTRHAKEDAIIERIRSCYANKQPVLVGTRSVAESESLGGRLRSAGIACAILNARNDAEEARIIADAGRPGAVTISTNMAGRGTDIHLGGADGAERDEALAAGGLCVIGTNCHESSRIDQQLAGRAGRQGDPGTACAYISLEDDLVERYAIGDLIPPEHRMPGDREITDPRVAREVRRAQTIIEEQHHTMRRTLRDYSQIVERRRRELEQIRYAALLQSVVPPELLEAASGLEGAGHTPADRGALAVCYMQALDAAWAGFLEWTGVVREGIHLRRYAGRAPVLEFVEAASDQYERTLQEAQADALDRYRRWLGAGADRRSELTRPGSTWTYLISDNPFPAFSVAGLAGGDVMAAVSSALFAPLWAVASLFRRLLRGRGGK